MPCEVLGRKEDPNGGKGKRSSCLLFIILSLCRLSLRRQKGEEGQKEGERRKVFVIVFWIAFSWAKGKKKKGGKREFPNLFSHPITVTPFVVVE